MSYTYGCSTDIGMRKKVNQDAVGVRHYITENAEAFFAVICDGVGGLNCGELASADTVAQLISWFEYEFPQMLGNGCSKAELRERVEYKIRNQNERLRNYGMRRKMQLGTTASILLCLYPLYYIWHVGDSRIYKINHGICQITEDQSLIQKEVNMGRITPEQAKHDKRRNIILQCLGTQEDIIPAFYTGKMVDEDLFLLCTDGIVHEIEEDELAGFGNPSRIKSGKEMEEYQRILIQRAKERGEQDNISVITVRYSSL